MRVLGLLCMLFLMSCCTAEISSSPNDQKRPIYDDHNRPYWEKLDVGGCCTYRLAVIGGWVLRRDDQAMVFIPDEHHLWEIE